MKKDSKKLLFEMMEKVNPDFKINEQYGAVAGNQIQGDVQQVQKTSTTAQQSAYSRINTPEKFKEAFAMWFSSLGFNPRENPISIGRTTADITNILKKLGYR